MSRYEEGTLTPVASPGVVGCGSVWLCVCVCVCERVCGFPMYCTVILFFFSLFVSFHCLVTLSGLCPSWAGRVRMSLLLGAGGKLALNVALPFRRTPFRPRALLRSLAAIQTLPIHASEETGSGAWIVVVDGGTSGFRANIRSSSLVLKRYYRTCSVVRLSWAMNIYSRLCSLRCTSRDTHTCTRTYIYMHPQKRKGRLEIFQRPWPCYE